MSWCKMLNYSIKEGRGDGNKGRRQEGVSDNVITKDTREKKKHRFISKAQYLKQMV